MGGRAGASQRTATTALLARRPGIGTTGRARTALLAAAAGSPHRGLPVLHVTGTNGKTSTVWLLEALLRQVGLRTVAYTSPHLVDVTERIRVDGSPVPATALESAVRRIAPAVDAVERDGPRLGFFDVLTVAACHVIGETAPDVAVVEVGRGGRDDATNVLDSRVVVLGPVALDHTDLGATPAAVAEAKLGLLRPGATLVSASQPSDVTRVVDRVADQRGCRVVRVGHDVTVIDPAGTDEADRGPDQRVVLTTASHRHEVTLPAVGRHQVDNLALALAAAEAWLGSPLPPRDVAAAVAGVRLPGRLELAGDAGGTVLLDGAHNPDGARTLAGALPALLRGRRCVLVVGCAGDKDVDGVVAPLAVVADAVVATRPPGARGAATATVAAAARAHGVTCDEVADPVRAVRRARRLAGPGGVVLVTGSLHLVGTVRRHLAVDHDPRPDPVPTTAAGRS